MVNFRRAVGGGEAELVEHKVIKWFYCLPMFILFAQLNIKSVVKYESNSKRENKVK